MSEAVDTRIVEAKFDSAQFEKGVDRTVKKLDELKKSLNLEESGKSITDLAAKTQSATEKASSAIEQLENRFTSFTGMLKQKLLSGIADEIVGVFFKIKNGVESMVRSLSSAQVSVGMSKYEQMLTSVRTMVASGSSEEAAYKAIETLGLYADQTSYSLDQMTSALSKMKAAGVGLDTGTKAVEGISNACAIAGINATDASRAFYNLSQAYSSGVLKYTDYRSLELLNMTTLDFKENMLEAAVAAGTLKKTAEGVYKTINTKDKKVTAGKTVTTKNLTDSLRYNFMNTEAMNALFGDKYFFDEEKWKELKEEFKALGKTEEEALAKAKELYGETAVNAYFAAREARSFTDVINTLKDVISRGWSKSFELIFGKLDDATKFFTGLTESNFAQAIYSIGEFRNNVLEIWSNRGGRDDFVHALETIDKELGEILGKTFFFLSGDVNVKAQRLGGTLISVSRDFANFTDKIHDWLYGSADAKKTRIERITDIVGIFGTMLKTTLRISGIAFNAISNIMGLLAPVFDSIIILLSKLASKINEVLNPRGEAYTQFYHVLQNIITIGTPFVKVVSTIIDVLGDVAAFFIEIAAGTFTANLEFISDTLGFILEVFTGTSSQKKSGKGVIQGIKDDVVSLGDALKDGLKAIGDFFTTLFNDLRKLIGISPKEGEEGGAFAGLKDFFNANVFIQNVKAEIKDLPNKIKSLFWKKGFSEELYKNIARFDSTSAAKYKNAFKGPFTKLIEAFTKAVKDFVKKVQEKTKDIWNTILDFFLGKRTGETQIVTDDKGNTKVITERVKEGFSKWLYETLDSVKNWMKSIPDKISKLWDSIIDFIFGKEAEPEVVTDEKTGRTTIVINRIKEGFSLWLSNLPENIKKLFSSLKDYLKKVWNTVVDFIFGREATADEISKAKAAGVENVNTRVKEGFSLWLSELPDKVMAHIQNTPERIKEVWNKVVDFIFGPKAEVDGIDDAQTDGTVIVDNRIKQGFSLWFYNLTEKVKTWIGEFRANISKIWDTLITAIFGNNNDQKKSAAENKGSGIFRTVTEAYQKKLNEVQETLGIFGGKKNKTIIDTVQDFANTIGTKIAEIISNLPTYIAEKVNFGLSLAGSVFDNISKWFDKVNSDEYRDMFKNNIDSFVKAIQEGDTSGLSPFAIQVIEIGKKISAFVKETIPGILSGAFTFISEQSGALYEAITSIFTIENWTAVENKVKNVGEAIANHIKKIPEYVAIGAKSIQDALTGRHGVGYSETEQAILDQFTDEQGRLAMTTEFRAAMEKSADQIAKEKEGWTIWGVISDIGVAIGDAFVGLGPTILQGINSVITWIGDGLTKVGDWLKGKPSDVKLTDYIDEQVELPENEQYKSIWESAKSLGSTIANVFTQVIPNFLRTAFETIVNDLPQIIGDTFGSSIIQDETAEAAAENAKEAVEKTGEKVRELEMAAIGMMPQSVSMKNPLLENEKDSKSIKDAAISTVGAFSDIFSAVANIATSEVGKTVALMLGVGLVLNQIKEILSLSDEIENFGYAAKWESIKLAILFITGLISYLVVLASTGSTDQLDAIDQVFEKIGSYIDKITTFLNLFMGLKAVGNIAQAFGKGSGDVVKGFGAGVGAAATKFAGATVAVTSGVSIITESIQNWIGDVSTSFGLISTGFGNLSAAVSTLDGMKDKIGSAIDTLGPIKDLLIAIRHLFEEEKTTLTLNPTDKTVTLTEDFRSEIESIMDTFTRLNGVLSNFKTALSGDNVKAQEITQAMSDLMGMKDRMIEFAQFASTSDFETFKYAISSLGTALSMYSGSGYVSLTDESAAQAIEAVLKLVQNEKILNFATSLSEAGEQLPEASEVYKQSEKLVMLATAVGSIGEAAKNITQETGENIKQMFDSISSIEFEKVDENGNDKLTKFAQNFGVIGNAIGTFANETKNFSKDNIDNARSAIDMTIDLIRALSASAQSTLDKVWNGDASIEQFGTNFATFATNLKTGLDTLAAPGVNYDETGLDQALRAIRSIVVSYSQLATATDAMSKATGTIANFKDVASGLSGEGGLGKALTGFITDVTGENAPDLSDDDFKKVEHALDLIIMLGKFAYASHGVGFSTEMNDLVSGLRDHNPFPVIAQAMESVKSISETESYNEKMPELLKGYGDLFMGLASLAQYTKGAYSADAGIKWYIKDFVSNIGDVFSSLHASFGDIEAFTMDIDTIEMPQIEKAVTVFSGIKDLGSALTYFSNAKVFSGIENLKLMDWDSLGEVAKEFGEAVRKGFSEGLGSDDNFGETVGDNIIAGLVRGIRNGIDDVKKSMQDLANAISGTFTMKLEINSPSKLFQRFGQFLGMGLQLGIDDRESLVIASVKNLATKLLNSFFNGSMTKQVGEGENLGTYLVDTAIDSVMDEVEKNSGVGGKYGLYGTILTNLFGDKADREKTLQYLMNSKESMMETAKGVMGDLKSKLEEVMKESGVYDEDKGFLMNLFSYSAGKAKNKVADSADARKLTKEIALQEASAVQYYRDHILNKKPTDLVNVFTRGLYDALGAAPIKLRTDAIKDVENEINQVTSDMLNYKGANLARGATDLNSSEEVDAQLEEYEKRLVELRERLNSLNQVEEEFVYTNGKLKDQGFEYRVTPRLAVEDTKTAVKETASDLWAMLKDMGTYLKDGMKSFDFNKYMPNIGDFIAIAMNSQEGISNYVARAASQFSSDLGGILSGVIEAGTNSALENGLLDNKESFVHLLNEVLGVVGYDELINKALDIMGSDEESIIKEKLLELANRISETQNGESEYTPVITPVVDMTNVDAAEEQLRTFGSTNFSGSIGGITMPTTTIDLAGRVIPPNPSEQANKLNEILNTIASARDGINQFSTSLSNMRFNITGRDLVYSIGPDIDEHIGREVVYTDRA